MNQKLPAFAALLLLFALLSWAACTKPTAFGSELLQSETADYNFTDTLSIKCTVEREDSTVTSDRTSTASYFLCGELNDPLFGKSSSEIYSLLQLGTLNPDFNPAIQTLDSIVLYLAYDKSGVYGDTTQAQTLHVFRLDEKLDYTKDYYSIESLPSSTEIGSVNFLPKPRSVDSLFVSSSKAAFLKVPLDNAFGNELLGVDSLNMISDTAFYKVLKGIKITTSTNGASPGAMMAFALNNDGYSRIRMYYTQHDTLHKTFDYYFSGANKFMHFTHNYTGVVAGQQIGQPSDDLMYVQGMNGLRVKVELPYVSRLEGIAVNEADLVLTAASVPGDLPALAPAAQFIFTISSGDTSFVFTPDVTYSLGPTLSGGFSAFGGFPVSETDGGTTVQRYRLALSDYLQQMVDDTSGDPKKRTLYINVYPQNRSAMRAILYGPKSAVFPAKLALKYTKL